ncbi:MAG: hypothetical protein AB7E80_06990 [Hyphomicrobiaceae bacterium]
MSIARGSVYLTAHTYAKYFAGLDAVALLVRDDELHVLPIMHMAAGGALLKIRNSAGDRVVCAPDLFAMHGLENWNAEKVPARWSSEHAALIVPISKQA